MTLRTYRKSICEQGQHSPEYINTYVREEIEEIEEIEAIKN